jgi:UDP-glucose 4-epimerase
MLAGLTGAKGFIGSYLLKYLQSEGKDNLRVLLRDVRPGEDYGKAEIVCGDLLSPFDCERFIDGLDVVYYLAHRNTPLTSDQDQPNDVLLNLIPLLNLLKAIQIRKTKPRIVYFSSGGGIYGQRADHTPWRETDRCEPISSYGIQKLAAEHYLRVAAEKGHLTCAALRIGNAYGVLLPQERMQGLIGVAINSILHDAPVRVFGSMHNVRDYIHLSDLASIVNKAAHRETPFSILNVGSGRGYSVREVLDTILDCAGVPVKLEILEEPNCGKWLTDWAVLDIEKARAEYDWNPIVDLASGIKFIFDKSRAAHAAIG